MTLLVISPDFASHYGPLAVLAGAARACGRHVVVATGPMLRAQVEEDGFEWRLLRLGAASNGGIAGVDPALARFIAATAEGPMATIRRQALDREHDLLWEPERVATDVARLADELDPARILVDHVSFGSTLAAYATGRPFVTLVPGHPSQLPVGSERYGIPAAWPSALRPERPQIAEVEELTDRVARAFTQRWNVALARVAPDRALVDDAYRVHGDRVLYNSISEMAAPGRAGTLADHRWVGPLVRQEALPSALGAWAHRIDDRPQVYVALGTFLSHRGDVLARITDALRRVGVRAAVAAGATPVDGLGACPDDWVVAPRLPQVAMLRSADLIVHHGGNNSVQEALAAGVPQLILPFSTDQFSNAADLERIGAAVVLSPNEASTTDLTSAAARVLTWAPRPPSPMVPREALADALFS